MRVARSAFYAYAAGHSHGVTPAKAALGERVREVFLAHRRRYGTRRISAELAAEGVTAGRHAVRAQMRRLGLRAIGPRRFRPATTDSRHGGIASPNLLSAGQGTARRPGEVVVGDITYLPLQNGRWGYLATWQDQFTKRVVGWAVAETMSEDLVIRAFGKALTGGFVTAGTILHTDRGSQYVAGSFRALLAAHGCRQSMARKGNCYDNATAESFFSRYKAELLEGGLFASVAQARSETFSYIEGYYNRVRRHSALGYRSPAEFERTWHLHQKGDSSERILSGFS
jgi:putative transposase